MKTFQTACPRDCQDCCSIVASVDEQGRLIKVQGDPDHPVSQGFLCKKGQTYRELVYHEERILYPLKKEGGSFTEISWEEAMNFMVQRIEETISTYGPQSILHFHYSGSEAITKKITKRFFGLLGSSGVKGDLCLSGGIIASQYDFGGLEQSEPQDLYHAKGSVVWGRNIPTTNVHLLPFIREAQSRGMELLVINPLSTGLEARATSIIRPRPGTDAALALGACHELIKTHQIDYSFIERHTLGFKEFAKSIEEYSPARAAQLTGVREEEIKELASFYVERAPVTTLLGFGLQRYRGGGNSIRAINALGALTGNIGKKGASLSYCSDTCWNLREHIEGEDLYHRYLELPYLGEEILRADPPIELAFIHAANPVVNVPHTKKMREALKKIETVVVSDLFMTDTAREAHLILPCTTFFEEENIRVSSWSPWIFYSPKVIEPLGEARPDEDVLIELARRLMMKGFFWKDREELLSWASQPLGVPLHRLRQGHFKNPKAPSIAWRDKIFKTPSKRFEFFSKKALEDGQSPTATFIPPTEDEYPLQLISPHAISRIHSQFQMTERMKRINPKPLAYLHPETGEKYDLVKGDKIEISNEQGELVVEVAFTDRMRHDVISLESGWDLESGGCANILVRPGTTEMGDCAAIYDTSVGIKKV